MGESIIEWKAGEELMDIQVSLRQLPYPEYSVDSFFDSLDILSFVVVFSLIYSAGSFTKVHLKFRAVLKCTGILRVIVISPTILCAGAGVGKGK